MYGYSSKIPPYSPKTGAGRLLLEALDKAHLKKEGVKFLQVKTVSDGSTDNAYAKTRAFYRGVGFTPIEIFPTLWDEWNPALLLMKSLQ